MIPNELMQEIKQDCCVPFLGGGVSTEGTYYKGTFLEHIEEICKYPKRIKNPAFPEVMQYYCEKIDGGRKNKLIREIISWIEQFTGDGEQNRAAIRFHKGMARVPYFRIFVTTNWDPFCERSLSVLVPMVEDRDIPFWDDGKRQVLKIHGCITRPQTIVATKDDYEKCMTDKTRGAILTRLRDLMAIKTFIFAGYSISDPDFKLIYDEVISNLGEFRRGSWVIDPRPNENSVKEWEDRGVRIIKMSGVAFADELTNRLEKERIIPSSKLIGRFDQQISRIVQIHLETSEKQDTEGGMASSMYQDGLLHSIEDIVEKSDIGMSFNDFQVELYNYERKLNKFLRRLNYYEKKRDDNKVGSILVEIAYWSGWVESLKRFMSSNGREIPAFFHPFKLQPAKKPRFF